MSNRQKMLIGKAIKFNPPESINKGKISKKIPMGSLTEFQRKIDGFEISEYNGGPKFKNGDTLVAKITPCLENGKTAYVDILDTDEVAFGSSEFIVLRNTEFTDPDFVYYFARSPLFRERAISCMEGTSGRKRVNENILKNLEFNFPILNDQQKIASTLSSLDKKIELNKKLSLELEAIADTIYNYWFVQFDFPDEKGKPYKSIGGEMEWNEKLKRNIPKGWEAKKIGETFFTYLGGTPSTKNNEFWNNGTINWLNSGEVASFPVIDSELCITELAVKKSATKLLPKGSVLLSITRHLRATVLGIDACANQSVIGIKEEGDFKYYYIYPYLKNEIPRLNSLRTGAQQPHINKDTLDESIILIPNCDYNLMDHYNKVVGPIFDLIMKNAFQNRNLIEMRDWLLPMLMNGQVTIE